MGKVTHRQAFVPVPLVRAIEALPAAVTANGQQLELTGQVGAGPLVKGLSAHRAHVRVGKARGWIDLSTAGSWRSDMTLRLEGLEPGAVELLLLAVREEIVTRAARHAQAHDPGGMVGCRTA